MPLHSNTLRNVVDVLYVVLRELKTVATGRERSTRGPRAQKRPLLRLGVLTEPEAQVAAVVVGYVAAAVPPHPVCPEDEGGGGEGAGHARKSGNLMAGTRPLAATVSSTSGTIAPAVRSGRFLPLPRGGRGRKRGRRSFLALAALVVDIESCMFAMLVLLVVLHLEMCSLRLLASPSGQASWLVWT